jgi:hypothetical protein
MEHAFVHKESTYRNIPVEVVQQTPKRAQLQVNQFPACLHLV